MSGLENIGVKIINPLTPQTDGVSGNADAILHELVALLETYIDSGENSAIDLHSLPLTPTDYELLRATLAEGEVHANINAVGNTEVRETLYPGVWWLTYYNVEGDIVADLLEVIDVPEILKAPAEDIRDGLVRLRDLLTQME
ncbi:MAG: hydrogenase expression/formation C-terminal domain-containing protein [Sulfuriferula sp.]|nr:hydrogenase expression/formation C-terminal domain-containing protein [Sulfuriferula sp.]